MQIASLFSNMMPPLLLSSHYCRIPVSEIFEIFTKFSVSGSSNQKYKMYSSFFIKITEEVLPRFIGPSARDKK